MGPAVDAEGDRDDRSDRDRNQHPQTPPDRRLDLDVVVDRHGASLQKPLPVAPLIGCAVSGAPPTRVAPVAVSIGGAGAGSPALVTTPTWLPSASTIQPPTT